MMIEHRITLDNLRLERYLKKVFPHVPHSIWHKWMRKRLLKVNKARIPQDYVTKQGDMLYLPVSFDTFEEREKVPPRINEKTLALLQDSILYEDKDVLVINKPQGLSVQGGSNVKDCVDFYMNEILPGQSEPLRLTHRLDKDTSGCLILAKNHEAARLMTQAFKDQEVSKTYYAIVVGTPGKRKGVITESIGKMMGDQKEMMSIHANDRQEAITLYEVETSLSNGLSFLRLEPKTGRTHQLRVHCAQVLDCPILGDGKYGGAKAQCLPRRATIKLHATKISFESLSGKGTIEVEAPMPLDFEGFLRRG